MDYTTKEQVTALSEIDPEFAEALKNGLQVMPMPTKDLQKVRDMGRAMRQHAKPADPDSQYVLEIPMRDGYKSQTLVHKPAKSASKSPLVVLMFGGGFILGDNRQLSPLAQTVAAVYGATVVNISYRLAPEHKFPTAPNDVWDSIEWIVANASSLGADPSAGFIIGGPSAGGNLAAVTAQKAVDVKLSPAPTGVWLCIPYVLEAELVPEKYKHLYLAREQNANAFVINEEIMRLVEESYQKDNRSPDFSPFNAKDPHKGLPPVYFQVSGQDPLRDDGLIYEKVLRDHGVKTKIDVYPGVPHGHYNAAPNLKISQKSNLDSIKGIGWLLGRDAADEEIVKALLRATPTPPTTA